MHASLKRLYKAVHESKKRELGPTELADLMNESPQTITNWARRGISRSGAIKAESLFGVSASYLLEGGIGALREIAAPGANKRVSQSGTTQARLDADQETDSTEAHAASHTQLQHTHTSAAVSAGQQTISPDEVFKAMSVRERLRFAHLLAAAFDDPPEIGVTVEGDLWVRNATQESVQEAEQRGREIRVNQSGVVVNPPAKKTRKGRAA